LAAGVPLNIRQASRKANKAREAAIKIRDQLWPGLDSSEIWSSTDRKRVGFAQVPRVLSLVMGMINDVTKKKTGKALPAGRTYLVLWLHGYGEGIVKIDSEQEAAYEAGYGGERGKTTFRAHMAALKDLGFVDYAKGPKGPYQWVLLRNPYKVVKELADQNLITKDQFVAFTERTFAVGAGSDLGEE
jgi:hypothetical protein